MFLNMCLAMLVIGFLDLKFQTYQFEKSIKMTKQEIKDELFGSRAVAVEVYPPKKNLVDVADIYHLWVLPKDYQLPFGIHPTRDPQGTPVQRGYDFNMDDVMAWNNSPERQAVYNAK